MAVTATETATSRSFMTSTTRGTGEWKYIARVTGEADPEVALAAYIATQAPYRWSGMTRQEISTQQLAGFSGGGLYDVTVPYSYGESGLEAGAGSSAFDPTQTPGGPGTGPGGGDPSSTPSGPGSPSSRAGVNVSFEIGGKPPRLFLSKETVYSEAVGAALAPDYAKSINVADGKVEGTDIPDPTFVITYDLQFDFVTYAYLLRLKELMWKVNNDVWHQFPQHHVALIGASGRTNQDERFDVSLKFGCSPQYTVATNELRAGLPSVDVEVPPWHFLWVQYRSATSNGRTVEQPYAMYVERLLSAADFTQLGIG